MTNDTNTSNAREAGAAEPVAWVAAHDCMLYPDYKITNPILYGGPEYASDPRNVIALYTQSAIDALRAQLESAQTSLDRLTGMKFSDRMHSALVARAEAAEAEVARLGDVLDQIAGYTMSQFHNSRHMADQCRADAIAARTKEAAQ